VCFYLRLSELSEDERLEKYGVTFLEDQLRHLREVYDLCEEYDEEDSDWDATDIDRHCVLVEKLFQFIISLLCERFPDGEAPASPLCYFTAVLGISRRARGFDGAANYTKYVSGLLWISRLFMLEYALPKYRYEHIDLPDRASYEDRGWRMERIRRDHMTDGSYSPFSRMVSLLRHGKKFAMKEGTKLKLRQADNDFRSTGASRMA